MMKTCLKFTIRISGYRATRLREARRPILFRVLIPVLMFMVLA